MTRDLDVLIAIAPVALGLTAAVLVATALLQSAGWRERPFRSSSNANIRGASPPR